MKKELAQGDRLSEIIESILPESERGAILLGCHILDDFLEEMIVAKKAPGTSSKLLKETLSYGGAFGSLSGKSKSLFVLGFLNEQSFRSIDILRGIRNKAAHSAQAFRIRDHSDQFLGALALFGENGAVHNLANKFALENITHIMMDYGNKNFKSDGSNMFPDRQACINFLVDSKKSLDGLEEQLPKWQLAIVIYLTIESIFSSFNK